MFKQIHARLHPPERIYWHGEIKKHWSSSGAFIVNFDKIPHIFLVFHCWIWGSIATCVYQQWPKYKLKKITKHVSTGKNYAILNKRVKVKHEKKFASNLKKYAECMFWANICKIYWDFCSIRIVSLQEKNHSGTMIAINDSSDVLCFYLYLINISEKSMKVGSFTDVMFKLTLYCLAGSVEDLKFIMKI